MSYQDTLVSHYYRAPVGGGGGREVWRQTWTGEVARVEEGVGDVDSDDVVDAVDGDDAVDDEVDVDDADYDVWRQTWTREVARVGKRIKNGFWVKIEKLAPQTYWKN